MNTGPLNSSSDAGFRASRGTDANGKTTMARSASESFMDTLERVAGALGKGPGAKKLRNSAVETPRPETPEIEKTPDDERTGGVGTRLDLVLASDCPISPSALPSPERSEPRGSQHSGDNGPAAEPMSSQGAYGDRTIPSIVQPTAVRAEAALPTSPTSADGEPADLSASSGMPAENEPAQGTLPDNADASALPTPPLVATPEVESAPSATDIGDRGTIVPNLRGTPVARMDYEMKNAGNRNEIPRAGTKEVPGTVEPASQSSSSSALAEAPSDNAKSIREYSSAITLVTLDSSLNRPSESAPGSEMTSSRPVRAGHLTEMILNEVQVFRQAKSDYVEVLLKPDHHTEIYLQFRLRNGEVEASARCQQGDIHALSAQWPQLQQTLSHQGVRLTDLNGSAFLDNNASGNLAQNQSKGQPQRECSPPAESLDDLPLVGSMPERQQPGRGNPPGSVKRLFDSWA